MTNPIDDVAANNNLPLDEVERLLLPDDARLLSPDERSLRAKLFNDLYVKGLSLQTVGDLAGGLSKERVRQIMVDYGYITRPLPGSKRWRDARKNAQASAH